MKTTATICKLLLVIMTIVLLISFFLPVFVEDTGTTSSSTSGTKDEKISIKFYQSFDFNFGILQILIPILATVLIFMQFKGSNTLSYGLYIASFFSNIIYACLLGEGLKTYSSTALKFGFGYYIMLIISVVILLLVLILIIMDIYKKVVVEKSKVKESSPETFRKQMEILNELKEENLLTEEEYKKKRAEILLNLTI